MKRLALLTVFFYVCTFAAPPKAQAVAPVALIAAAAVGTAMMSASIGTYYAQNGVLPEYVTSTANAVASAADKIFQPSYLAVGAYSLITPDNLKTAGNYYVGKAASIGATIADIVSTVKNDLSDSFPNFKSVIDSSSVPIFNSALAPEVGETFLTKAGDKRIIVGINASIVRILTISWIEGAYASFIQGYDGNILYDHTSGLIFVRTSSTPHEWQGQMYYPVVAYSTNSTTLTNPFGDPYSDSVDYPTLKDKLLAPPAGVASDIANILKALPASKITPTSATPNTVAEESAPPAITQADINAALKANTAAVAQAVADAVNDIATANPDDAAAQTAAAQAALEAAQAAEAAAEAANQPEPEPEPSYPVPSTWYTKTCDLSNGLGSCIDYQQVINATSAFQSTALYQFPNLILQCLGYVEGDGCEYPPKISVDLFTRFSTGPINVDLSPFESVVKVMKFFFAILCLVGTGKATMTLFE